MKMKLRDKILITVQKKHAALMDEALVNIDVYENSVGIGEHSDIVEAVEAQVEKYVHSQEIVDAIDHILND
jgi:hypothetical protein